MGGGGSAPKSPPDPNIAAEKERKKAVSLSQLYAQKAGYMGTSSTDLSGKSHTALTDYGESAMNPAPAVASAPAVAPVMATTGSLLTSGPKARAGNRASIPSLRKTAPVVSKPPTQDEALTQAFNDYNQVMAYRSKKRQGLL